MNYTKWRNSASQGGGEVRKLGALSEEDLELLIERKILEILGDPDAGLELRPEFKRKLEQRLEDSPAADQEEVARRFGGS